MGYAIRVKEVQTNNTTTVLQARGLTKSYTEGGVKRVVLQDANLEIRRSEIVVIVGRSGSGKSTLLNLLGGIDTPDAGDVWIDGQNATQMNEKQRTLLRRDRIGFIFQFFNLIPTLTAIDNLLLPLELSGKLNAASKSNALELMAHVGLAERMRSYPDVLSGGEQQRLAIARALAMDPALILADEPTGNLDVDTAQRVVQLLDDLVRKQNKTLVMVTHSPEVMGTATRTLRMDHGKLVAVTPATIST